MLGGFSLSSARRSAAVSPEGRGGPCMTFGQAIQTGLRTSADFGGSASRPEFWWFILFTTLVWAALPFLVLFMPSSLIPIGAVLSIVGQIAMLLPTLAVAVRRLRDAGYPWTQLCLPCIP